MKLAVARRDEKERADFSKKNSLIEGIKRRAAVAAILLSATFTVHCGGENPDPDGGTGGDGGTMQTDGGTTGDGGTGGDGGVTLCAMYGEGSPNRATFTLGQIRRPEGTDTDWAFFFKKIENIGGTMFTSFGRYEAPLGGTPPVVSGFEDGQTRDITFGAVTVRVQLCSRTPNQCAISLPGGSGTGDTACTATAAADRAWTN